MSAYHLCRITKLFGGKIWTFYLAVCTYIAVRTILQLECIIVAHNLSRTFNSFTVSDGTMNIFITFTDVYFNRCWTSGACFISHILDDLYGDGDLRLATPPEGKVCGTHDKARQLFNRLY